MDNQFTIVFEPALEGGYTVYIPEIPGAISEGETVEEAREMVLDALRELTEYRREVALRSRGPHALVEHVSAIF
jgi:antitoxin HicB